MRRARPLKDRRPRQLRSLFGVVAGRAPRLAPCRCSVGHRQILSPVGEIMPDRCTPDYERTLAEMGARLPYRRARALLDDRFPLGTPPVVETIRQRTLRVGARLERQAAAPSRSTPAVAASSITLSIDTGHVRAVPVYQVRTFEIIVAQASNDNGKPLAFASVPDEAYHQAQQLRGVLHELGATQATPVTILSDGADGPRAVGEAASLGPTRHVLDCFTWRCAFTMSPRRSKPARTTRRRTVRKAPALPISSRRTSVGGCGTGRCSAPSI